MLIRIEYKIERADGEYRLYVIAGDRCAVLHSSYYYRPCYEAQLLAKSMQRMASIEGKA